MNDNDIFFDNIKRLLLIVIRIKHNDAFYNMGYNNNYFNILDFISDLEYNLEITKIPNKLSVRIMSKSITHELSDNINKIDKLIKLLKNEFESYKKGNIDKFYIPPINV